MNNLTALSKSTWITPEWLQLFCRANDLVIGFGAAAEKLWISPYGPSGSSSRERLGEILDKSSRFEVAPLSNPSDIRFFVTRNELEAQLRNL